MKNKKIKAEQISIAIGEIGDSYIESANALRTSGIKNVRKSGNFLYRQFAGIAAAVMVLAVGSIFMLRFFAPEDIIMPPVAETVPEIGEIIQLGEFDWRVLDVQDGRALIITENVIENRPYHSPGGDITWEHSEIREYLNGEFYENTFTDEEKIRISETVNINRDSQYGTAGGNNTTDKLFLLSVEDALVYFIDGSPRKAFNADGDESWWLLRSPGNGSNFVLYVANGFIDSGDGADVSNSNAGIRPAMWVRFAPPAEAIPDPAWTWIVEPTLDYPFIMYTDVDDIYFVPVDFEYTGPEFDFAILCEATGGYAEIFTNIPDHYEDRSIRPLFSNWLYDAEFELFGRRMWETTGYYDEMYPVSEFAERFPQAIGRIKHVYLIDSLTFDTQNAFQCGSSTPPGTVFFDGKQIISDARFRGSGGYGREFANIITAYSVAGIDGSGGVGIINQNGDFLVPVMFWEINLINETTAFARIPDGNWGIIGFGDYAPDKTQILEKLAQIVDNLNVGITGVGVLEHQVFYNLKHRTNYPIEISWSQLSVYCEGKYVPDELTNGLGGTDYYQNEEYRTAQSPHLRYIAISDLEAAYNEVFTKNAENIIFSPDSNMSHVYGDYVQVTHHSAGAFPIMIPAGHAFDENTITLTYATAAVGGAFNGFSNDIITFYDSVIVGEAQYDSYQDVLNRNFEYQLFSEIAADNYAALLKIDYTFVLEDGRYKVQSIKPHSLGNADTRLGYDRWFQEMTSSDEIAITVNGTYVISPDKKSDFIDWLQSLSIEVELKDDISVAFTMPILTQWNFVVNDDFYLNYTIFSDGIDSVGFIACDEWYRAKAIPFDLDYFIN
ncbi:MAG: DUF6273 domain-containing protein [Oscillospiraceae bacterium]|nr:DUF6273 domain-containing protein [Oscillospiraceae bacterium]